MAKKCSEDISSNLKQSTNCKDFYSDTFSVLEKTKIKSITFDHKIGKIAVMNNEKLNNYKWHTWHVDSVKEFKYLKNRKNTGIINSGAPRRAIIAQIGSIEIATIKSENTAIKSRNEPARTVAQILSTTAVSPLTRSIKEPGEFS